MEELQCCVCRELLCRPHTLPCSHTFCAPCLFSWERRPGDRACVICRAELGPEPPLFVRQLDACCSKLALSALVDEERTDWLERAEQWDRGAEAARAEWAQPKVEATTEVDPPTVTYVASRAPNDRSTCRRCLSRIGKGEVRHGVRSFVPLFGQQVVAWHHAGCLPLAGESLEWLPDKDK